MKFEKRELLIFDLDGTLVDSASDLAAAVNMMLKQLGKDSFEEDVVRGWVGNGARVLVKRALCGGVEDEKMDEKLFKTAFELFMDAYSKNICVNTKLYPGVKVALAKLAEDGYRMAIATNKPSQFVRPILEALSIESFFEVVVGGDDLPEKKPHPAPLLNICERVGVNSDRALMVGDSKNDILAAKAAGMASIGVAYGYNYGEDIAIYEPDAVATSFLEILDMLKR
ncbi:MAG: phosphoglycolate phosphatase [Hydrogenimonas sp.]|nr:phosphoglycolate phosphatase [Hydrogenimonas sp.]